MAKTLTTRHDTVSAYIFISPFFIIFAAFGIFPLIYTMVVSFHRWDILGNKEFIGLSNFVMIFTDPVFWQSVVNTFAIWFLTTIPQMLLSLVIAFMLNRTYLFGKHAFRLLVFVPNITSTIAVALIFTVVFGKHYGLVNQLLQLIGLSSVDWQGSRFGTLVAISTMINWRWTGHGVIIFLAALQSIPKSYYEAATLDGANAARQFFSITIPVIKPIIIFKLVLSTIGGLNIFVEPLIFSGSGGGAGNQGLTMTLYLYEEAFRRFSFGYASAIAWMLFLFIIIFVILNYVLSSYIESE
jgi:cellobiose transport system permease protein